MKQKQKITNLLKIVLHRMKMKRHRKPKSVQKKINLKILELLDSVHTLRRTK